MAALGSLTQCVKSRKNPTLVYDFSITFTEKNASQGHDGNLKRFFFLLHLPPALWTQARLSSFQTRLLPGARGGGEDGPFPFRPQPGVKRGETPEPRVGHPVGLGQRGQSAGGKQEHISAGRLSKCLPIPPTLHQRGQDKTGRRVSELEGARLASGDQCQ